MMVNTPPSLPLILLASCLLLLPTASSMPRKLDPNAKPIVIGTDDRFAKRLAGRSKLMASLAELVATHDNEKSGLIGKERAIVRNKVAEMRNELANIQTDHAGA